MKPLTYPARPVNGGPLDKAIPKSGVWEFEAKYNGWRAEIHTPSGTMFNRHGNELSIASEFKPALEKLKGLGIEWVDCEALERRHGLGRSSLIVLDIIVPEAPSKQRRFTLELAAAVAGISVHKELNKPVENDAVYLPMRWQFSGAAQFWPILKQCNQVLGCDFYEGIVAKRADSFYPIQLVSPGRDFPFWMKHRWGY